MFIHVYIAPCCTIWCLTKILSKTCNVIPMQCSDELCSMHTLLFFVGDKFAV